MVRAPLAIVLGTFLLSQSTTARIVVARASVRAEASATSPIVAHVMYGDAVEIRSEQHEWFEVLVNDSRVALANARVVGWLPRCALRSSEACATPKSNISVAADVPSQKTAWLSSVALRVVPIPQSHAALSAVAASPSIVTAFKGETALPQTRSAPVSWVWTVPRSALQQAPVLSGRPMFLAMYQKVAGLSAEAFMPVLVRLIPAAESFLVATAIGPGDAPVHDRADWMIARDIKYDVVATTPEGGAVGMLKIRPSSPLAPGTYAVVLRPMYLQGYSGARVLSDEGQGLAFGQAWAFAVR